jgi:hypothetical protein
VCDIVDGGDPDGDARNMGYDGCCGNGGAMRSFLTKQEKVEMLKEYRDSLEREAKGVGERIKELERNA